MRVINKNIFFIIAFLFCLKFNAALKTCTLTGNWGTGSTWSGGAVPACGDSIVIPVGYTVTITVTLDFASGGCSSLPTIIVVKGALAFQNGRKFDMACGSRVYLYPGSDLISGGGNGNNNYINICGGAAEWTAGDGSKSGPLCYAPTDPICILFLPIQLMYFNAEVCDYNKQVCLNWATASEINNDYFTIERSNNASEFTEIVKINGAGTSYVNHNYNYVDEQPINGLSYYRLKQTDFDNTFTYSPIVAISLDFEIAVQNPSHSFDIPLTIKGNKGQVFDIKLVDVLGRVCYNEQVTLSTSGNNKFDINLQNKLSSCVVYLLVSNNFKTAKAKVVID